MKRRRRMIAANLLVCAVVGMLLYLGTTPSPDDVCSPESARTPTPVALKAAAGCEAATDRDTASDSNTRLLAANAQGPSEDGAGTDWTEDASEQFSEQYDTEDPTDDVEYDLSDADEEEEPVFVMPEGAVFEPQVVLVDIPEGTDLAQVTELLADALGDVEVQEVSEDVARVTYAGGKSVEEAVNALLEAGAVGAVQPNYAYTLFAETASQVEGDAGSEGGTVAEGEEAGAKDDAIGLVESAEVTDVGIDEDGSGDATGMDAGDANELVEVVDVADDAIEADVSEEQAIEEDRSPEASETDAPTEQDPTVQGADDSSTGDSLDAQAVSVNDPLAKSQWELKSINAYDAWSYVKVSHKVTVATLDLGFEVSHPDLKANIVDPYNAHNAVHGGSTTNVTPNAGSLHNHGTHVAGIISAVAGNGIGSSGVSYNAYAMPIKVVDNSNTAYTDAMLKAYDYVLEKKDSRNVRVVNLSMGMDGTITANDALLKKVSQAYEKGVVTVAAAGNVGSSNSGRVPYPCYPADYERIVGVINLEQSGSSVRRSDTSNYNDVGQTGKNISAPGTSILSTVTSSDYDTMSGTSMAAPVVSGVLALEFAANPNLSASDAVTLLYATAKNLGGSTWTRGYGWGEVNAAAAAKAARDGMTSVQKAKASEVAELSDKAAAQAVVEQIASLPAVGKLKVSHASQVSAARTAYNGLTAKQRGYVTNLSKLKEAEARMKILKRDDAVAKGLSYRAYLQRTGWQGWKSNGSMAGSTGQALQLEAIQMRLSSKPFSGTIQYRAHVQSKGWESGWRSAGSTSGVVGQSKRLEAIQIRLTEQMAAHYDVWYRVHAQHYGWMGWTKNGDKAGTAGYGYRLEAIQVKVLPKGSTAPGSTLRPFCFAVSYRTHVQRYGWQGYVHDGATSGTSGQSLRLEGININVNGSPYTGEIAYRTHVQTYGWQGWKKNGQMSGTSGQSKRLEAIQIKLTGELAKRYDVWYRVHAQHYGWMGWAKNGASAGTQGYAYRLEAIQIRLVTKGGTAPGNTAVPFRKH